MTLSPENQLALEDLLVGIEVNENRLGIFIAVCDDPQIRQKIVQQYERLLADSFKCYQLVLDREEPRLKGAIAEQVAADEGLQVGEAAVMTVLGSERLFSLRLGEEQSQQEKFFGYLQWTREGLREYPFAIVLWVTYSMLGKLSRQAPDFWSWRQDVVRFVSSGQRTLPSASLALGNSSDLELLENVGSGLPVAELEGLIENSEEQDTQSAILASLHAQAGKGYIKQVKDRSTRHYAEDISSAVRHLESALQMQRLSEVSEGYADNLMQLASLYELQKRYGEAESLYLQALELRQRLLGEAHPDVATSLSNLAGLYWSQRRYGEAESLYLQALELRQRLLGEEHPDVATSLNNLAGLYWSQGRYEEAESLYLQDIELSQRLLGEEHPDVATSLNNLAGLYWSQGRYEEAESLYLQSLVRSRRLLGEEHPDVATSLNNLGALYLAAERYGEAESFFLEALAIRKAVLPPTHPYIASTQNWLKIVRVYLDA